ncbi:MAG: DUF5666 domain-containing protein [Gammaproteobacteria bacterium]|nr:DUF5666 domain-containing protein [Gammaproteobacteria bacterium]
MNAQNIMASGFKGLVSTGMIAMLVACGGGGGRSDDNAVTSVPVVARGVITQLGSIWVNGVEYETPNGNSYASDDSISTVADYKVGQFVRIRGRRNANGISGIADEVEYEAEIEGAADGNGDINGVVIMRTPNTNAPGIPDPLSNGIRYEVSGIWVNDTTIEATFIKVDDDGDGIDEIKGFVQAVVPGISLTVHGVVYSYGGPTVVSAGDFVEVHFTGTVASMVEFEDEFNDDNEGQEVEFEGAVNLDPVDLATCPAGADFLIDATCIDWDSVPASGWMDGLADELDMVSGIRVEAEGHFNAAGLLIAEKIKGRGNRVRVSATVDAGSIGAGTFTVFDSIVAVTTQAGLTEYDNLANFNAITDNAGLEIRGIRTGPGSMLALRIKAESVAADKHKLRAEVDENGANSGNSTITVMGVTSQAGSGTELELNDAIFTGGLNTFLDLIDDDNIVNTTNGPRDVVEMRFDITTGDGSSVDPYAADEIEIEEEDD